ncbi:MAG: glycoside hydrolase family 16 protein [Bacteroidota bacterium]
MGYAQENISDYCHIGCAEIQAYVNPCPNNPSQKPGYYLLLNEHFYPSTVNQHWNISINGDDGSECTWSFRKNPDNVTYELYEPLPLNDGLPPQPPQAAIYHAKIWNTNVPVPPDCPYSCGEIKTLSVLNDYFKSYYFYGSGYVEAKVKIYAEDGQGAAMWLWCVQDPDEFLTPYHNIFLDSNEIDIFETHDNSTIFDVTYHWKTYPENNLVEESHCVDLHNHAFTYWTVFALEWSDNYIKWFVNNTLIHQIDIPGTPAPSCGMPGIEYISPSGPFCLRFGSGPNAVGDHNTPVDPGTLPKYMEIEYIRVYKKEGELASPIKIFDRSPRICITSNSSSNSDKIISANYYPNAVYQWSSPAFEFESFQFPNSNPHRHHNKMKIWVKSGVEPNQTYPIYLTVSFPWGHVEYDTCYITVIGDVPSQPPDLFFAEQSGNGCFFHVLNPILDETTTSCQFFDFITQTWRPGSIEQIASTRYAADYWQYEPGETYQIRLRERNVCGYSENRNSQLTMPPPPPNCLW